MAVFVQLTPGSEFTRTYERTTLSLLMDMVSQASNESRRWSVTNLGALSVERELRSSLAKSILDIPLPALRMIGAALHRAALRVGRGPGPLPAVSHALSDVSWTGQKKSRHLVYDLSEVPKSPETFRKWGGEAQTIPEKHPHWDQNRIREGIVNTNKCGQESKQHDHQKGPRVLFWLIVSAILRGRSWQCCEIRLFGTHRGIRALKLVHAIDTEQT